MSRAFLSSFLYVVFVNGQYSEYLPEPGDYPCKEARVNFYNLCLRGFYNGLVADTPVTITPASIRAQSNIASAFLIDFIFCLLFKRIAGQKL